MQDEDEPCYLFPSTKNTIEEDRDGIEVIIYKVLVETLIALGKDKTKTVPV